MIDSISGTTTSLLKYEKELAKSADRIAQTADPEETIDLPAEFSKITVVEHAYSANLEVLKTEDKLIGDLIDVVA